jgi:hypothetical protein
MGFCTCEERVAGVVPGFSPRTRISPPKMNLCGSAALPATAG